MQVVFDVPDEVASQFSLQQGGVSRAAIEALAVEGVRTGKLTEYQARIMLGITTRYEMDGFLRDHGVTRPETYDDVVSDSEAAASFVRK
jgi:hypothetical protein